ncbi:MULTISPECIES: peptidase domain-containing ABC transporter [unclassified Sphingobium]|uniref:peptidase domain-containing ABC transporter n=1 Tax=unclassified Sphingobium TaxID=2611147 RepID=UPI00222510A5|nr:MULTISPECIES: peptidase domain-containing ABC transporter [unclassified Sphingobium]MCW2395008.1 ATP-binding cassette subfamily B protein RaxB [Sphingobium sp. B8D3B]MCW2418522.1 ATP-binding cassette subfamily B protein RaxB [Sphingobium sp. B8D3C]
MNALIAKLTGRRRIRPILQTEAAECGLASLAMVANWHGHELDLNALRQRFGVSARGMTLRQLMQTADNMQLLPRPLKLDLAGLHLLHLPAILHWDLNHFVVLERVEPGRAYVVDPVGIARWYKFDELGRHFSGVALELRPSQDFQSVRARRRLRFRDLWSGMTGARRTFAQTVILSIVMQVFILASPFYLRTAVDEVLPAQDGGLLLTLALGFGALALIGAGAALLRKYVLLSSGALLSFGITSNIVRHLFRLPIAWFEKRKVGDILTRVQSVLPIQRFLIESAPLALIDGTLSVLTLVMMFLIAPELAPITLVGLVLYSGVRLALLAREKEREAEYVKALGREQGTLIETLRGMVTLRLAGREAMRHSYWQNRLTEALGARYQHERVKAWHETAKTMIPALELVIVIFVAVRANMNGAITLGTLFAYLAFRTQFVQAGQSLLDEGVKLRLLELHLDQLADIVQSDEDAGFAEPLSHADFSGRVELRDVHFAYGPHDPPVLRGVDLVIEPGDHVAITGASGSGKTTLAKIILGLIDPTKGEVLIDGQPLPQFGRRAFREHVAAVLQDDVLYAGSIADNVAAFGEIDPDRLRDCLKAAAILEDIEAMPMRTETLVGDMGSTLSGGQKQRILLARALYREPAVLLLDEGTAHLDLEHEAMVNRAVAALGITRLIIAHRPETIAAADRVIRVENGVVTSDSQPRSTTS